MATLEIPLPKSTLTLASGIVAVRVQAVETRVTLKDGNQCTLAELLGEPVDLVIVNETVTMERVNARQDSCP